MSLDLHDLRTKLTVEGHAFVEAEAQITGKDKSEIVREIVHAYAVEQLRRAEVLNVTLKRLEREGIAGQAGARREK